MFILILISLFFAFDNLLSNSSPVQPDFTNFESVNTSKLVNEFDGSFTYNLPIITIPGPNGSGYTLSLSYHSGLCPEGDASWVGYGWTLNPGSIIRNFNGFPDDNYETKIKYWNKVEPVTTTTIEYQAQGEIWSSDLLSLGNASLGLTYSSDFGYTFNIGCGLAFPILNTYLDQNVTANLSVSNRTSLTGSFLIDPKPFLSSCKYTKEQYKYLNDQYNNVKSELSKELSKIKIESSFVANIESIGKKLGNNFRFFHEFPRVSIYKPNFSSETYYGSISVDGNYFFGVGGEIPLKFRYNSVYPEKPIDEKLTIGFMYSDPVTLYIKASSQDYCEDYSIEKDYEYNNRSIFLGIPFGNPDYFNVTGEGIGGSFRAFRKSANYLRPPEINCQGISKSLGIAIDIGASIGFGVPIPGATYYHYVMQRWNEAEPDLSQLSKNNSFFFRFMNDLADNVDFSTPAPSSSKLGNDLVALDLSSISLISSGLTYPSQFYQQLPEANKIRCASYIGYNTLEELYDDFNKIKKNIPASESPYSIRAYNKKHIMLENMRDPFFYNINFTKDYNIMKKQIMEFSITNSEGMNYVYGLPVFSRNEKDLRISNNI
jgi:hypothetical protein